MAEIKGKKHNPFQYNHHNNNLATKSKQINAIIPKWNLLVNGLFELLFV